MKTRENTRNRVYAHATATPTVEQRITGAVMATFFAGSALIGIWSVAAMVGGLVAAGGPGALFRGFAQAVLGV